MTDAVTFTGKALPLSDLRALAHGAQLSLAPDVFARVDEGAAVVAAIVKKGEAVYGINTGFGKLANVRIADNDLETLQCNLVLSHAAGVGEPVSSAIVRLMMALKLISLGRGASGVRRETLKLLHGMLMGGVVPLVPARGSVGASGDLAPLAHMTAAMIGEGDAFYGGERMPAVYALGRAGLEPIVLAPKEGLALLNGTQFSHRACAACIVFDRAHLPIGFSDRRNVHRCRTRLRHAVRRAHPDLAWPSRPDRRCCFTSRADGRQHDPRLAQNTR